MERTADIVVDEGRQLIRLPEDIHFSGEQVRILHDERSGQVTLLPNRPSKYETLGDLLKALQEIGPAEADFLLERNKDLLPNRDLF